MLKSGNVQGIIRCIEVTIAELEGKQFGELTELSLRQGRLVQELKDFHLLLKLDCAQPDHGSHHLPKDSPTKPKTLRSLKKQRFILKTLVQLFLQSKRDRPITLLELGNKLIQLNDNTEIKPSTIRFHLAEYLAVGLVIFSHGSPGGYSPTPELLRIYEYDGIE